MHASRLATQELGVKNGIMKKAKLRLLRANFSKKFSKRHCRWRGHSQKQIGSNKLSLSYTFETEKKAFRKAKKEHQPNYLLPLCTFFNDIYILTCNMYTKRTYFLNNQQLILPIAILARASINWAGKINEGIRKI